MRKLILMDDVETGKPFDNKSTIDVVENEEVVYRLKRDQETTKWVATDLDGYIVDGDTFRNDLVERLAMIKPSPLLPVLQNEEDKFNHMDILLGKFIIYVNALHQNDKYSDKPYIYHLASVRNLIKENNGSIIDEMIAYGHDSIEDHIGSFCSHSYINQYYGLEVADGIASLNHNTFTTWDKYINWLVENAPLNILAVKLADLSCNYEQCKITPHYKEKKYKQAIEQIITAIQSKTGFGQNTKDVNYAIKTAMLTYHKLV